MVIENRLLQCKFLDNFSYEEKLDILRVAEVLDENNLPKTDRDFMHIIHGKEYKSKQLAIEEEVDRRIEKELRRWR